jgi:hypothetical protein
MLRMQSQTRRSWPRRASFIYRCKPLSRDTVGAGCAVMRLQALRPRNARREPITSKAPRCHIRLGAHAAATYLLKRT